MHAAPQVSEALAASRKHKVLGIIMLKTLSSIRHYEHEEDDDDDKQKVLAMLQGNCSADIAFVMERRRGPWAPRR